MIKFTYRRLTWSFITHTFVRQIGRLEAFFCTSICSARWRPRLGGSGHSAAKQSAYGFDSGSGIRSNRTCTTQVRLLGVCNAFWTEPSHFGGIEFGAKPGVLWGAAWMSSARDLAFRSLPFDWKLVAVLIGRSKPEHRTGTRLYALCVQHCTRQVRHICQALA